MIKEKAFMNPIFRVCNEECFCIEVGESIDGGDYVEMRTVGKENIQYFGELRLPLSIPMTKCLIEALQATITHLESRK